MILIGAESILRFLSLAVPYGPSVPLGQKFFVRSYSGTFHQEEILAPGAFTQEKIVPSLGLPWWSSG